MVAMIAVSSWRLSRDSVGPTKDGITPATHALPLAMPRVDRNPRGATEDLMKSVRVLVSHFSPPIKRDNSRANVGDSD